MNNLKARIKGTDRVIEVVSYSRDNNWIEYEEIEDGQVRYNTRSLDEVELIVDNAPSPIDWEQRKYEIAKDVLSSSFSTPMEGTSIISYVRSCVQIADMLVAELKGGEQ
ncbi:hypothetical protein [Porphyromonas endodontalis]